MDIPLDYFIMLSVMLFGVGVYGVLTRRSIIRMLMGVEIMMNAANINLIAFSIYSSPFNLSGQVLALFSIAIAAAEVAVGLAILILVYRNHSTIDVSELKSLNG